MPTSAAYTSSYTYYIVQLHICLSLPISPSLSGSISPPICRLSFSGCRLFVCLSHTHTYLCFYSLSPSLYPGCSITSLSFNIWLIILLVYIKFTRYTFVQCNAFACASQSRTDLFTKPTHIHTLGMYRLSIFFTRGINDPSGRQKLC